LAVGLGHRHINPQETNYLPKANATYKDFT
jgi:hypothetical protein